MARSFDGSTQWLRMSPGAFASTQMTYGMVAVVARPQTVDAWQFVAPHAGGGFPDMSLGVDGTGKLDMWISGARSTTTSALTGNTGWYLVAATKTTGTTTPRFHWYSANTGTWSHENGGATLANGAQTLTNFDIGRWQDNSDHFNGDMAAVGCFRTLVPSDAEIEAMGLHVSRAAWLVAAARADRAAVWLLDQAASANNVIDLTGGGANQSTTGSPGVATAGVALFNYAAPVVVVHAAAPPPTDWLNPTSDVATNSWVDDLLVNSNIYTAIDENTASDADYIQCSSGATPSNFYECALESQTGDAGLSTLHTVSYRLAKVGSTAADLTVSLRQGAGTEIASWTHTGLSTSFAGFDQTLSAAQADAITYPTDLRIRFAPTTTLIPPSLVADRGSTQNLTGEAATLVDLAAGGSIATGNYLIARIAVDNSGASGAKPGMTVTDPRSNTWTVLDPTGSLADPGNANAGAAVYVAYAKVTTAYVNGDDITFNWTVGGTATAAKAIVVEEWTGIHATSPVAVAAVGANGSTSPASISITPNGAAQLVYTCLATEGPAGDTAPNDTTPTNGAWTSLTRLSTTSGTAAANQTVAGQVNTTATSGVSNTWDPAITARDWAAIAVVFANNGSTSRTLVSWAGMTIPYAAPPATERWQPRFIYQPAAQRASTW